MTAAASRRSCARRRWPNRPATDRWKASGSSHGGQVEQRGHDRQARGDRERAAPDGVIDRAGRTATLGPPGRTDRRAAQQERVDGHRPGAQQAGRRQLAAPDDLEVLVARGRVVEVGADQEREGFAGQRLRIEGAEQPVEVGGGERRALGCLERPGVEHDPDARASAGAAASPRRRRRVTPGHGRRHLRSAPGELLGPQLDDDDQRLDHDPPAHLGLARRVGRGT